MCAQCYEIVPWEDLKKVLLAAKHMSDAIQNDIEGGPLARRSLAEDFDAAYDHLDKRFK
jgi:hypothetical protein